MVAPRAAPEVKYRCPPSAGHHPYGLLRRSRGHRRKPERWKQFGLEVAAGLVRHLCHELGEQSSLNLRADALGRFRHGRLQLVGGHRHDVPDARDQDVGERGCRSHNVGVVGRARRQTWVRSAGPARKANTSDTVYAEMAELGVVLRSREPKGVAEETAFAYKDIESIMAASASLVRRPSGSRRWV